MPRANVNDLLAFLAVAIVTRSLRFAPEMRLPIAAMIVVSLLLPNVISGSSFADIRLPVMLPFVIIASTRFAPSDSRIIFPIAAVALTVLGVRIWTVSQAWRDYDHWFAEFRTASTACSGLSNSSAPPEDDADFAAAVFAAGAAGVSLAAGCWARRTGVYTEVQAITPASRTDPERFLF